MGLLTQRPSDVTLSLRYTGVLTRGRRTNNAALRIWGREHDVFLPRSHRALNVLRENKQRPSDVGCRVPRIWGKEKTSFCPGHLGLLTQRFLTSAASTLSLRYTGVLTRGRRTNNAALRCLESGVRKKTFFCLGRMGQLTRRRKGYFKFGARKKTSYGSLNATPL